MVDTTEATESQFLTAELVNDSETKKAVVINGGEYKETDFGKKLQIKVNIDKKEKIFRPNRETCLNLSGAWGKDSDDWVGKTIKLKVVKAPNGKDSVLGKPYIMAEQKEESNFISGP